MRRYIKNLYSRAARIPDKIKTPLLFILLYSGVIALIFLFLGQEYVFGSYIDWNSQHGVLPDFFRQKFYETGSLFPSFALELGAGIDPYMLAYHGMLNPVILPSYFFPGLNMYDYIIISSLALFFISVLLLYLWMRQNHFSRALSYFSAVLFAFSGPLLFHFHKQIMFVNYFPFLILALMGIDRMLLKRKRSLFIISFALTLMSSFFFSFAFVITVSVYWFYRYLKLYRGRGRHFLRSVAGFALSGVASCLLTCVLILPSFMAIINGREINAYAPSVSFIKLFIPQISFSKLLYGNYGAGLGLIVIFALFALLFLKRPHTTFLAVTVILLTILPIGSFVMNAFLYTKGKAFICLLPLFLLAINIFLDQIKKINIPIIAWALFMILLVVASLFQTKFLAPVLFETVIITLMYIASKKTKSPAPICIYSACAALAVFCAVNSPSYGEYLSRAQYEDLTSPAKAEMLTKAADSSPTRVGDITAWYACNQTYKNNLMRLSIYSSSSNLSYLHLCHNYLSLTTACYNKITVPDTNDPFFSTLMGQEWIIGTKSSDIYSYEAVSSQDKWTLYHSEDAYTLGFAAKRSITKREFENLSPADRQFALLEYAVTEDNDANGHYSSPFTKIDCENMISLPKDEKGWRADPDQKSSFTLDTGKGERAIYAVHVKIDRTHKKGIVVTVNGVKNVLSGKQNVFPNDNSDMWFIISDTAGTGKLQFDLSAGRYHIPLIEVFGMSPERYEGCSSNMIMANKLSYNGDDTLNADITLNEDGIFLFTIPYDKGFTLTVDGKPTPIKIVDCAFIGCKLEAGQHNVSLRYTPPYRTAGIVLSCVGALLLATIFIWDHRTPLKSFLRLAKRADVKTKVKG